MLNKEYVVILYNYIVILLHMIKKFVNLLLILI